MKVIVGLGNPGPKYETTRHNVGFLAIDRLVDRWGASGPVQKFQGEYYQCNFAGHSICLVKPQTYMNLSGRCVSGFFSFYHVEPEDLIVIHDDLALSPLSLRFKTGGGTGGHNGLKSIDECLGKDQSHYHRIRVGIGHPSQFEETARMSPADYVLQPFRDDELVKLDSVLNDLAQAAELILRGQIQMAMNQFHHTK